MDIGIAIIVGLIVGACVGGGIIYAGLLLIADAIKSKNKRISRNRDFPIRCWGLKEKKPYLFKQNYFHIRQIK